MLAIRVRFKKEGRAKYISHLDLNRCMQRALRRAQIPIWRTQGFNPHQYIVFAMPLSIFYESSCEIMDARLDGEMQLDVVKGRLSAQMPEGIVITGVELPVMKLKDIGFASYSVALEFEGRSKAELENLSAEVLSHSELIIEKPTKHGTAEIDVRQYLDKGMIKTSDGAIELHAVLPAGPQKTVNPSCITAVFGKCISGIAPDFEHIRRLQIYDKDMHEFI